MAESKTLNDYFAPITANPPNCIVLPTTEAPQFEIRPATIHLLPKFHGFESEQPDIHLGKFLTICNTFKSQNLNEEGVKLRLFPLSLEDKVASWLNSISPNSIRSWNELAKKFMNKFYPMQKTESMRGSISNFRGKNEEQFHQIWERFHDLILKCPHHGFDKAQLVQFFYKGLSPINRTIIESMNQGKFKAQTPDQAYTFLEELAENAQNWNSNTDEFSRNDQTNKTSSWYEIKPKNELKSVMHSLTEGVKNLTKKFDTFALMSTNAQCNVCSSSSHPSEACPVYSTSEPSDAQVCAFNTYRRPTTNTFSQTYHPDTRNHSNFSWRQNLPPQNLGGHPGFQGNSNRQPQSQGLLVPQSQFPPNTQLSNNRDLALDPMSNYVPPVPQNQHVSNYEDTLKMLALNLNQSNKQSTQRIQKLESRFDLLTQNQLQFQQSMQNQLSQLTSVLSERQRGTLPSQPKINPQAKGVHHIETSSSTDQSNGHVNSIITLRSGKQIDNKVELPTQHEHEPSESRALNPSKAKKDQNSQINNPTLPPYVPPVPFPSRLVNNKKDSQYSEISEIFQNLQINIPFLTAIKQIPSYAKFIKDLVNRKTHIPKEAFIAQHCSSFLQNQAIVKHKDPGSPTITCRIGDTFADQALLDLQCELVTLFCVPRVRIKQFEENRC
ncbi:uncharacterized protein LOC132309759 [Cornus florida]|uniref:uncharacterized protein LOC132309759 n=1 Tax=Cornus florida TaxID=4283 RepID=UPI00289A53F2|nr:uncharacterized protein LOC132309759 [Cornus florida]